ncbi:unnamed protein product [Bursaphelenchus xylophilus]|uniref:(pine wood nematode) hypothetical protein n=1 Tax=Bursaphelenchus xylophilus TaxID=6326 RepID=A0A7I8XLH3_BURXY|nr:unnamed protein product [Bursaphelenchus xylophilus]CAG9089661.1 unnamed protein product [Bursaphelenchus xylophilus]
MFVVPRDAPEFDVSIGKLYTTPHCDEGIRYIIVELRLAKDLRAKGNSNFTVLERKFFYDGSMMNLTMILGDRHEVALRNESEIDSFLTKIKVTNDTRCLGYDANHCIYFYKRFSSLGDLNENRDDAQFTNFYRKDLLSRNEPELLFRLDGPFHVHSMSVSNNKLFILYNVITNRHSDSTLLCYDLRTGRRNALTISPYVNYKQSMISHGNTFLCSRLFVQDILLYTITENGFEERVVQCYRRQQLNKDTHIIIQKEGEKLAVKTMSIIEDEPVFRFVQYCHAMCAFGRISNNFFWVFERKKRCFWYQEGPTFAPYLLHSDSQPTRITGYRVQQTLKNEFYLL